ncbi:MAG: aldehyde ferredoxin oxidoreductase family protein [Spirochaetota bacterium]
MHGYTGLILHVDLTNKRIIRLPLDIDFARKYVGGTGIGARLYLDMIKNNIHFDALSPDNPFIIMTGPLTGIRLNAVARWTVCSRSPQNGLWSNANVGGFFGAYLKFAGYDGMVITGSSKTPVYIFINDEQVEIRDATSYWGMDTYVTNDTLIDDLREETGRKGEVLTIGPAGEKCIRFASLVHNKGHAAGRTGMGAVWGSKNLKAVYVSGTGKISIADQEGLSLIKNELKEEYRENTNILGLSAAGTCAAMDVAVLLGDIPMKNWQRGEWEHFDEIGPGAYADRILVGNKTCYACGVACKRVAEVKNGKFAFAKGPGPEYETVGSFGPLCLNADIESIGKANDICNRFGMDTISCGSTIAFAIECFENGLIDEKDTDGLKLKWGNADAIVELTEKIGRAEGFGKVLSLGSEEAARIIGGNAFEFLTTVKGLEAPMHDPRSAHGVGLAYAVSPRGACHMASLQYNIESGQTFLPEFQDINIELVEMSSEGKAELNIIAQDFGMFFSHCAVFCNLGAAILTAEQAISIVNCVTGFDYTIDEVMQTGRMLWYLHRGLANLSGVRSHHDKLPGRLLMELDEGPTAGTVPDMEKMKTEFYRLRSLDAEGIPTTQVFEQYGLQELNDLIRNTINV